MNSLISGDNLQLELRLHLLYHISDSRHEYDYQVKGGSFIFATHLLKLEALLEEIATNSKM